MNKYLLILLCIENLLRISYLHCYYCTIIIIVVVMEISNVHEYVCGGPGIHICIEWSISIPTIFILIWKPRRWALWSYICRGDLAQHCRMEIGLRMNGGKRMARRKLWMKGDKKWISMPWHHHYMIVMNMILLRFLFEYYYINCYSILEVIITC